MSFPRTEVGGLSVSRMVVGTNWFLGWTHCTAAKDDFIRTEIKDRKRIADILEVFFRRGVDTVMGLLDHPPLADAVRDAEDRTGVKAILVGTPGFRTGPETPTRGFDLTEVAETLDRMKKLGCAICMPHSGPVDNVVDRCARKVRAIEPLLKMIREREMIPGLSTHLPETIIYSDESGIDVETYISIYNAMGFLMPLEVDWINRIIRGAKKPVMTIKPLAAGQIRPLQAMSFVWSTIRPIDMVTVGTMTPKEAEEIIDISLNILGRQGKDVALQETRSKAAYKPKASQVS